MFNEKDHPRGQPENSGQFVKKSVKETEREKTMAAIRRYSDDPEKDLRDMPSKRQRIKVAEITSSIYDDMVLSNGRKVKDIVTRAVEIPLTGSAGVEHIENHPERKGMVAHYIGFMSDIINDPDYVFEDTKHENTLQIERMIDKHTLMVVRLNYDNPDHTNTVITMLTPSDKSFDKIKRNSEKFGRVLYKKIKT